MNPTVNKQTVPKLLNYANENDFSRQVLELLANRERAAARSDIDALFRELETKKKKEVDYFQYLDVWKAFQDLGLGNLVHGRKGNPNRFVWYANLRHVGRIGLGMPLEDKIETVVEAPKAPAEAVNTITFVIPASVPMEEIKALIALGASLSKPETKKLENNAKVSAKQVDK